VDGSCVIGVLGHGKLFMYGMCHKKLKRKLFRSTMFLEKQLVLNNGDAFLLFLTL
jgi:hypothetical protein